jgi:hypothetical protein
MFATENIRKIIILRNLGRGVFGRGCERKEILDLITSSFTDFEMPSVYL